MCVDYRKLNISTQKDHFPLPFIGQMLERLTSKSFYYFLDGYSGYNQIVINLEDQEKSIFTCSFGTYANRKMPFGPYNAPATFQRYMMTIFYDYVKRIIEVFMDDFTVYDDSFNKCLESLSLVLERGIETNLFLPFMREGNSFFSWPCRFLLMLYQRFLKDYSTLVQIISQESGFYV